MHDDVVYVIKNNTMYKRYLPRGGLLVGNPDLLAVADGPICHSNKNIVIYKSYEEAKKARNGFIEDKSLLPVSQKEP